MSSKLRAPRLPVAPLLAAVLLLCPSSSPGDDRVAEGHKLFKDEGCPQCHGFGGKGDGYLLGMLKEPVEMRDWSDPAAMSGFDDAYLFDITKKGGAALGKSKIMLKYGHKLSDEQIRAVVAYIRSVQAPAKSP